jgi:hypothetical protein
VRQRQVNGLIKSDPSRILPAACSRQQGKNRRSGEDTRILVTQKGCDQNGFRVVPQILQVCSNKTSTTQKSVGGKSSFLYLRLRPSVQWMYCNSLRLRFFREPGFGRDSTPPREPHPASDLCVALDR